MTPQFDRNSILEMAQGAIKERVDYEMTRILDNILDVNTAPTKKRTLSLSIELIPDSERQQIRANIVAKSKLEPTNAVNTSLFVTADENGEMAVVEMVPQIPGQTRMDGKIQDEPMILRMVK